jgi:hypothetical protein
MRFRPLLLCLSLCAGPLAAEPFRSGEIHLSPAATVRLAPRIEDFASRLCAGGEQGEKGPRKNSATCRDMSVNVPRCCVQQVSLLYFGISALQALKGGVLRTSLFARAFVFQGPKPLETSCGRWTYSLRLDPRATQPMTAVTLQAGARDVAAGTFFAAALPLRAQLSFQKVGGGRRVTLPVVLRLDLTGTWAISAAASAENAAPGAPADSRLVLSVDRAKSVMTLEGAKP